MLLKKINWLKISRIKFILTALLSLVLTNSSSAQTTKEDSLRIKSVKEKSGIIFFLLYTSKWPDKCPLEKRKIGILSKTDQLFRDLKIAYSTNDSISNKDTTYENIVRFERVDQIKDVNLLYADLNEGYNAVAIMNQIQGKSILLVTDNNPDYENSMINFLSTGERQFFSINKAIIKEEKMKVNFIMRKIFAKDGATLTENAKEWTDVYSKYKTAVQTPNSKIEVSKSELLEMLNAHETQNKRIDNQLNEINIQREEITKQKNQIEIQRGEISSQISKIQNQKSEIENQLLSITDQKQKMELQQQKLDLILNESNLQQKKIKLKEDLLKQMESERKLKEEEIAIKESVLKNNQQKIELQNKQIDEQSIVLKTQKSILAVTVVIALIIGFLGFISFRNYRQKEVANARLAKQNDEIRSANREIELQKHIIEERNKEVTDSILYAQKIQAALLPTLEDFRELLPDSFILFKPRDIVSGDFYWITEKNNEVIYVTADCTGHGVPGGFMTMLGTSMLNEIINEANIIQPSEILDKLREKIMSALKQKGNSQSKDGMDMVLCSLNKKTRLLTYAAANNNLYLLRNGALTELKCDKQPIGIYGDLIKPFTQQSVQLQTGDIIYTYTDGYADQFGGPKGKKFKYRQLEELIISNSTKTMQAQCDALSRRYSEWQGLNEQIDDVCIIGVRI